MTGNSTLLRMNSNKNDELYTQYPDIEREIQHYSLHGLTVYCNCDNSCSNFIRYFRDNFDELGLKKLICTGYNPGGQGYKYILDEESEYTESLIGEGDFRSDECIRLLNESDIVITNPPFSLFREFIATLFDYDKKFIIIGPLCAASYTSVFPLIKEGKLRIEIGGISKFILPDNRLKGIGNTVWYTNMNRIDGIPDMLPGLSCIYSHERYPKYDNCDAIHLSKVAEIPIDYKGLMGVPLTYLSKHDPSRFDIVRFRRGDDGKDLRINGKDVFAHVLIRWKN